MALCSQAFPPPACWPHQAPQALATRWVSLRPRPTRVADPSIRPLARLNEPESPSPWGHGHPDCSPLSSPAQEPCRTRVSLTLGTLEPGHMSPCAISSHWGLSTLKEGHSVLMPGSPLLTHRTLWRSWRQPLWRRNWSMDLPGNLQSESPTRTTSRLPRMGRVPRRGPLVSQFLLVYTSLATLSGPRAKGRAPPCPVLCPDP